MALPEMAGDADQAVLLLIPRKADAIIRLIARLISPEDGGAVLLSEDHRAAEIGGVGLAAALVIDDEKRAAVGEEFSAVAVRRQLDVATLAAAIALGPAAGRSLDVGGIAERREQRPVRTGRFVFCLREGRSAQAADCQQDRLADCFQEGSPVVAAVSALNRLLRPATMQAAVPGNDPPTAGVDFFR
jgi:hypothetical protein